jgi:hypothetical protein
MKSKLWLLSALAAMTAQGEAPRENALENGKVAWHWQQAAEQFRPVSFSSEPHGPALALDKEYFQLALADGKILKSSDFKVVRPPGIEHLKPEPNSPTMARRVSGRALLVELAWAQADLKAEWRVILRDGSSYVRQVLTLRAGKNDVMLKEIILFDEPLPDAKTVGTVDGSPIVAGPFFLGYEHPMARNVVGSNGVARCSFVRNAVLKAGEVLVQSCVIGVAPDEQLRRGFLAYLERERAHPYRPFLHYNSWFDIAWDKRKFTEAECLDAINQFGLELVQNRQVQMESFLLDDGWDDNRTLWRFHDGFAHGFEQVRSAAAKFKASPGVWISPFGGYDLARTLRLEYGSRQGFETNAGGFSLSGPKYYQRFHDICLEMVKKYGVNMFKFDGLAAGEKASENGQTRDGDAMLRLISDLRLAKPDLYINQTVGTWPSPFWLLYVDSTWRGGADHDFCGKGTARQQWITYRDSQTYENVIRRGPMYPLNSLMLHGIICATHASKLGQAEENDFRDEVRSFFASGTQLQELYVTPGRLTQQNWNNLAQAAKWSRANADVLVDTHWVGGDPGRGQIYGWASWSPRKAILALRNPDDSPAKFTLDARAVFQLPVDTTEAISLFNQWKNTNDNSSVTLQPGKARTLTLEPFEVVVLESKESLLRGKAVSAAALANPASDQTGSEFTPDPNHPAGKNK